MKPKIEENAGDTPQEGTKEKEKVQVDSDQEMMNLDNEIYSLTHYADDEEELVAQMFATIKGSKLDAMMPPILKEIPLIDVQQLCLHELRGMSQRRILSIINGQEMSGSSSEGSDDERKHSRLQDDNEDSNLGGKSLDEGDESLAGKDINDLETVATDTNLTTLDLLELEMRAKLIKTMLEKQDGDGDGDEFKDDDDDTMNGLVPDIKIKEEPLTPESSHAEDKDSTKSPLSRRHRSKYSRRHRRSDSRSYSSSSSHSSRSSYSSRSSKTHSSEAKKSGSESPGSKKPTKKKITKKEFEARMRKAKMNRSYRKRKDSEDDSGEDFKKKKGKKKPLDESSKSSFSIKQAMIDNNLAVPEPEEDPPKPTEVVEEEEEGEEKEQAEDGEITEKEEGEIDSNEEGACSSRSKSRSRSYSSDTFSSSSSRSYSRSSRRRRKKGKKSRRRRRSRSRSSSDVPKIPNWQTGKSNPLGKVGSRLDVDNVNSEEDFDSKDGGKKSGSSEEKMEKEESLPVIEDRQSISFSINKKNSTTIKTSSELNDDGVPSDKISNEENSNLVDNDLNESDEGIGAKSSHKSDKTLIKGQPKTSTPLVEDKKTKDEEAEPGEVVEDFYKGAEQLTFSEEEGEIEDEAELERFLHDDTPVEPINDGDSILRKSVKVVSSNDEPPIVSWENKRKKKKENMLIEGVGYIKNVLSGDPDGNDSHGQESNDPHMKENLTAEEDTPEENLVQDISAENTRDILEPLPETEAEDSLDSHNLDIIGVIDPTENSEEPFDDELAAGGSSWSTRWLQSEKVQKVVSNSKMLSKVRKKIQAKGKNKNIIKEPPKLVPKPQQQQQQPQPVIEQKPEPLKIELKVQPKTSSNVIGSIEEYEKLFGIKVKAPTSLPQPKPQSKPPPTPTPAPTTTGLLFSDDDEDSEEEALWSKIFKK